MIERRRISTRERVESVTRRVINVRLIRWMVQRVLLG